jgi:membrane protease YdiL (CAAX protease family)
MRKMAAVLEVLGVYMVGQVVGVLLARALGIQLVNPLVALTADASQAELYRMSGQLFGILIWQYIGWFLVALPVGWWHRRRPLSRYGVTLGSRYWGALAAMGVVLFTVAEIWTWAVNLVHAIVPLGHTVPWRETIFTMAWTPAFWVLTAVGSFLVVPPLEELFYRGYVQTRLEEDLGAPAAILGGAGLFVFSHAQYHILDVLNVATMLTMIVSSVAAGYVFYVTRSLVPVIVAHALVNIPIRGPALWVAVAIAFGIWYLNRRAVTEYARGLRGQVRGMTPVRSSLLAIVGLSLFALGIATMGDAAMVAGFVFLPAALVLEWIDRRRQGAAHD